MTQQLELMRTQANELIDKFKEETESKLYLIDRRMITGFLVQYVNPKATQGTKKSMLDALSKILCFNDTEKQELGMIQPEKSKIGQSLVNYLLGDDDL